MIRRPPRSTPLYSSAASDVYKRQVNGCAAFPSRLNRRSRSLRQITVASLMTSHERVRDATMDRHFSGCRPTGVLVGRCQWVCSVSVKTQQEE
eukprot:TRINITY_DN1487_c0_g1_i24.p1 TRINITY_DN1487_c0_g1~~TRINITY_DN1487_c0_g1_i24.p1  ORF type:complete len:101 (+),score=10.61 TRINITY_DN1487_c0_g1_i24:25-303(+)